MRFRSPPRSSFRWCWFRARPTAIFTNSSETYVNFQDYNGSETKCDKKDNAYITDSPGTSGTQGLVNDPLVTYYLFAAVNWVVEAPSVVGAYYNQTSWDWSNGVTVKLNRGSSDKALNKTDGFKNK